MTDKSVSVERVQNSQDIEDFIRFPFKLYQGDLNWVPPLLSERREFLDPKHNPFFDHADAAIEEEGYTRVLNVEVATVVTSLPSSARIRSTIPST